MQIGNIDSDIRFSRSAIHNIDPHSPDIYRYLERINGDFRSVSPYVNGNSYSGGEEFTCLSPHNFNIKLGTYSQSTNEAIYSAISTASNRNNSWKSLLQNERNEIFLEAIRHIENTDVKYSLIASIMSEMSKNASEAIGDLAEFIDFVRANVEAISLIGSYQPNSSSLQNHMEYRPLEGFVFAVSPFNFIALSNLAFCPALLGNSVIWKPAENTTLTSWLLYSVFLDCGMSSEAISFLPGTGKEIGSRVLSDSNLSALSFTGSNIALRGMWQTISDNIKFYRDWPRIVGETGGKDFVLVDSKANVSHAVKEIVAGAFGYQGQKCAAASRAYISDSIWDEFEKELKESISSITVGDISNPNINFGSVINAKQYDSISRMISAANQSGDIVCGGEYDCTEGYFIWPTVVRAPSLDSDYLNTEYFGPVLSVFVYPENEVETVLKTIEEESSYALTGSIFSENTSFTEYAADILKYSAGNLYINNKPTGALVNEQPFGGSRASGTNDKSGTIMNCMRFISPRVISSRRTTEVI